MKLILIGFMGSGKTTAAQILAKELSMPLVELDDLILEKSKRESIVEIFELDGEEKFRDLESQALRESLSNSDVVISTGGGVVVREENLSLLRGPDKIVIYLKTSFDVLEERISGDESRPLFQNREQAFVLYSMREEFYKAAATTVIDTDQINPNEVVQEILGYVYV